MDEDFKNLSGTKNLGKLGDRREIADVLNRLLAKLTIPPELPVLPNPYPDFPVTGDENE